jgi:hypothetical protein
LSTHLRLGLPFWLSHQYPICIPSLPHSCYMPYPYNNANYIFIRQMVHSVDFSDLYWIRDQHPCCQHFNIIQAAYHILVTDVLVSALIQVFCCTVPTNTNGKILKFM